MLQYLRVTLFSTVAIVAAVSAFAGKTIPRQQNDLSEEDRERVKQVTRPAIDFSKPEKFETRQGVLELHSRR